MITSATSTSGIVHLKPQDEKKESPKLMTALAVLKEQNKTDIPTITWHGLSKKEVKELKSKNSCHRFEDSEDTNRHSVFLPETSCLEDLFTPSDVRKCCHHFGVADLDFIRKQLPNGVNFVVLNVKSAKLEDAFRLIINCSCRKFNPSETSFWQNPVIVSEVFKLATKEGTNEREWHWEKMGRQGYSMFLGEDKHFTNTSKKVLKELLEKQEVRVEDSYGSLYSLEWGH